MAAGLGACSSTTDPPPPSGSTAVTTTTAAPVTTTTVSTAAVAAHVSQILANGNNAITAAKVLNGNAAYTAASTAFNSAALQLQAFTYPAAAQSDAKTLVAILFKLSEDATQMVSAGINAASVGQNIENDEGTEEADSNALRHDLALSPATP
jgi:hypothetical protein